MSRSNSRRLVVLLSLVSVLTLTATLLLAIAPAPLSSDGSTSLSSAASETTVAPGRWTDVLLCGSPSDAAGGFEQTSHFLLVRKVESNGGRGFALRPTSLWQRQQAAPPPAGVASVSSHCVVVAVPAGIAPTAAADAIATLRETLSIAPQRVWSITR